MISISLSDESESLISTSQDILGRLRSTTKKSAAKGAPRFTHCGYVCTTIGLGASHKRPPRQAGAKSLPSLRPRSGAAARILATWNEALPPRNNFCTAPTSCQPRSASCQKSLRLCCSCTCHTHGSIACPTASIPQLAVKGGTCCACVASCCRSLPTRGMPKQCTWETAGRQRQRTSCETA